MYLRASGLIMHTNTQKKHNAKVHDFVHDARNMYHVYNHDVICTNDDVILPEQNNAKLRMVHI